MKKFTSLAVGLLMITGTASAQNYKNSIGAVVGMMDGISYKTFFNENVALKADLAYKYTFVAMPDIGVGHGIGFATFELNPNLFYQKSITGSDWGSLDWYVGGGVSLGYYFYGLGKFGANAIIGAELPLSNIPLTFDFDFRPGYGLLFADSDGTLSYFDWAVTLGVRYCF